ncbi:MAG: NAD-dependent epimerase/dehydratase family protein [Gammaproteobacteria bacterium]
MKVFVTGGTGAIGRPAVISLVAAGHSVTALARSEEKASEIAARGATPVRGSLFDTPHLASLFAGHDAVVNLATALPATADFARFSAWEENIRIRTEGSASVVDAALEAGVPRLLQESVSMIYRDRGNDWIDEDCATDDFPMARSNHAAESSARRFTAAGGVGVVLRFGWFYGSGASHSEEFLALARKYGVAVMIGPPRTYVSSIHVADGGHAVAAALQAPAGCFNIVDDEPLTKRDFADAIARAAGRQRYIRAPGRLALLLGDNTTSLTRSLRVSNARFRRVTDWSPRYPSARDGFAEMIP